MNEIAVPDFGQSLQDLSVDRVPNIPDGEPLAQEWRAFKQEVRHLINDGHLGRFAVFHGDKLIGIWDTVNDAIRAAQQLGTVSPCLVQEIQLTLKPVHWGYFRPCPE